MVSGLLVGAIIVLAPEAAAGEVRAGVAREAFALPAHVPLAGYSRRGGSPSTGLRDPVGVRALVVQDADTTVALVSCDLLIIDERLTEAVERRLAAGGLSESMTLLLAATHTHSGPGGYGTKFLEKLSMGHYDPDVFEAIVASAARAVIRAHTGLSPVRVAYGAVDTRGLVENRVEPEGIAEGELQVCAFYGAQDGPLAVLVSFAGHPTTLGAWNTELSADYPGVVAREVEQRFPSATCLFFAAAVGDQRPVKYGTDFEPSEHLGRQLARHVVEMLNQATPGPVRTVESLQERVALPPARVRVGRLTLPTWFSKRLVDDDATLTLVAVGATVFVGVPCDLAASLGQRLKEAVRAHGRRPVVVGFANDYIGYCLPEALYDRPIYEASLAFNGPLAGELVTARLTEMVAELSQGADGSQEGREDP